MQKQEMESIWADGVPQNLKPDMVLNYEQLLQMGIDYIVKKFAIPNGFKVEQTMPRIDLMPHIILKKNGQLYAIVVAAFLYPQYAILQDEPRLKMIETVSKFNAIPLYCPIGFRSIDEARAKAELALKGDVFNTNFKGFIVLKNTPTQDLVNPEDGFTLLD